MRCEFTIPVRFSVTGTYGNGPPGEDDVYTVKEFQEFVRWGAFVDYDGFGYPVKDEKSNPNIIVKPSRVNEIPEEATHIVWFNR